MGLGAFIARKFHEAEGTELTAYWCKSEASATDAATNPRKIGPKATTNATPYFAFDPSNLGSIVGSIDKMLSTNPDIVAICSPSDTHLDYLQMALDHNAHVLVEKPIAESSPEKIEEDLEQAIYLVKRAEENNLVIAYNASLATLVQPYKEAVGGLDDNKFEIGMHMPKKELLSVRTVEYTFLAHTIGILQAYFGPNFGISDIERKPNEDETEVGINYKFKLTREGYDDVDCSIDLSAPINGVKKSVRYFGANGQRADIESGRLNIHEQRSGQNFGLPVTDYQDTIITDMIHAIKTGEQPLLDGRAMVMNQVLSHVLMGDLAEDKVQDYHDRLYN